MLTSLAPQANCRLALQPWGCAGCGNNSAVVGSLTLVLRVKPVVGRPEQDAGRPPASQRRRRRFSASFSPAVAAGGRDPAAGAAEGPALQSLLAVARWRPRTVAAPLLSRPSALLRAECRGDPESSPELTPGLRGYLRRFDAYYRPHSAGVRTGLPSLRSSAVETLRVAGAAGTSARRF